MTHRIQTLAPGLSREVLAQRTHIFVDWPKMAGGTVAGEVAFDNQWYLRDDATGSYVARDAMPAPNLTLPLAEAMSFGIDLPEPVTRITGAHVSAYLRAMHAERMEVLLEEQASPPQPVAESLP